MTEEESGTRSGTNWALIVGILIASALAFGAARWMGFWQGQPAPGASPSAAAAQALQASFEHYQAGRFEEAIASAKEALSVDPNLADAYNNLAVSYLGLRKFDDGAAAAREAIRIQPDHQRARNNLAWILREQATAAGVPPPEGTEPMGSLLDQSARAYQEGRFSECMEAAAAWTKLNPTSAEAFNNIGICAGELQLWDDAIRNTEEAIRLQPDFQLAKNNLAWMQAQRAKSEAAK